MEILLFAAEMYLVLFVLALLTLRTYLASHMSAKCAPRAEF